ncbi:hypothetical protein UA08_04131 [Talaromyces atroroseus]|uniref:Mediator complex subunit 15 KIX domain-containing protein n=1 Tax=Talaromyces atroroseus TaxID=1441469 RepID=A0A1Q5Q856_TALAT|nr:hypothetical protein UA08_04131 [Talaromyces atroroseus]OKL60313.1 hypothetical protein UA08_04131 [Talaromyces atroroseus]
MNQVNFSNVGTGAMLTGANPQGAMPNNQTSLVSRQVAQVLQSQGPYTGWRAEVPIQDRAQKVWQMITSLRLIQPRIEIQNALQAALSFEEKAFREANQKADYEKECTNKLHAIKETRLRQQAVYNQGGLIQHGGATGGMPGAVRPNQVPPQFNPQVTRPMQSSPVLGQMPMHMGLSDPSVIQQQQQQLQQRQQQALAQNQMGQQRLVSGMPVTDELSMLSQAEFDQISQMAAALIARIPLDDLEKRRMNVTRGMSAETKQMITQKYGDPFTWMMRVQLLRNMRNRQSRTHMARAQGLDANSSMGGGDPMLNAAQRQMTPNTMGLQRNSALPMNNQQTLDPSSFINVENIQGQQADGLRSQEAGQLVVPASNASMSSQPSFANPSGLFQPGALPQNTQTNLNRPVNPQQLLAQQQQQLQNAQNAQTSQFQAPGQVQNPAQAQARAQAAHNAKMAMSTQAGGQNASQLNQNMPHQSPAMPMLNRPVGPNMSPAQAAAQGRPPSRQPGMNGQQQQTMRPQIPPNLPPAMQERLSQMTPDQMNAFLLAQRRMMSNNPAARMNGQSLPMQTNLSQPSQGGGQFNDPNMRTSMALQQSLDGIAGGPQNNPMFQGQQQLSLQQQQLLRQQQQLMRSQNQNSDLSLDQIRDMDRMPFPPAMINSSIIPTVPKGISNWGQLKGWVVQNPQILGSVDFAKLLDLQRLHYTHTTPQQREAARLNEQAAQANWAGNPQPFMSGQNAPTGRPQPLMPPGPPVTATDILNARQRVGSQSQNWTDEQVKALIIKHRQKIYMQQLQARGINPQQLSQAQSAQQAPVPNPASTKPMVPPLPPATQAPQQTQPSQTANVKPQQTPVGGKNVKATATSKTTSKKRPHSDEVIEIQNPKSQPTIRAPTPQPTTTSSAAPTRPPASLTSQQLAALSPQHRTQLEAHMKRQSRPPLSRAAAEENWNNNLPEQLKNWYNEMAKAVIANAGPLDISAEDKALMGQQLRESTDMLSRMDSLVHWMVMMPNQEKHVKMLLSIRIQLMKQFKDTDWTLNDEFTVAPDYVKKSILMVRNMFSGMISKVQNQQIQKPKAPIPQAGGQSHVPPLNASNLQQLEEEAKRARRASHNVPAAPTTAQPPFPLGNPSPQGVPQAYGPGGFSPDKLNIPPSKRRKQSHASVSASQSGAGSKTTSKADSLKSLFKCAVAECEHNAKGFASQAALDKHVDEEHRAKEDITDPLKYALESFDAALGVPTQDKVVLEVQREKKSISGDATLVKQEGKVEGVTPTAGGATPMSRLVSHTDAKFPSPVTNNLATPRLQAAKVANVAAAKKTKPGAKQETVKTVEQPIVPDGLSGWADSHVSLDVIQDTFDIPLTDDYPGLGGDYFDEFLNADMFTISQNEDTPDSVDSNGLATQTPKDGEMTKEDLTIQIKDIKNDESYPLGWFSHPGPMFPENGNDNPWIDWEVLNKELQAAPLEKGLSFSVS